MKSFVQEINSPLFLRLAELEEELLVNRKLPAAQTQRLLDAFDEALEICSRSRRDRAEALASATASLTSTILATTTALNSDLLNRHDAILACYIRLAGRLSLARLALRTLIVQVMSLALKNPHLADDLATAHRRLLGLAIAEFSGDMPPNVGLAKTYAAVWRDWVGQNGRTRRLHAMINEALRCFQRFRLTATPGALACLTQLSWVIRSRGMRLHLGSRVIRGFSNAIATVLGARRVGAVSALGMSPGRLLLLRASWPLFGSKEACLLFYGASTFMHPLPSPSATNRRYLLDYLRAISRALPSPAASAHLSAWTDRWLRVVAHMPRKPLAKETPATPLHSLFVYMSEAGDDLLLRTALEIMRLHIRHPSMIPPHANVALRSPRHVFVTFLWAIAFDAQLIVQFIETYPRTTLRLLLAFLRTENGVIHSPRRLQETLRSLRREVIVRRLCHLRPLVRHIDRGGGRIIHPLVFGPLQRLVGRESLPGLALVEAQNRDRKSRIRLSTSSPFDLREGDQIPRGPISPSRLPNQTELATCWFPSSRRHLSLTKFLRALDAAFEDLRSHAPNSQFSRTDPRISGFPFAMVFYLIGLGLGDERDVSVRALEIIKRAAVVFLDSYTSVLESGLEEDRLSAYYGRPVVRAARLDTEAEDGRVAQSLREAATADVAFLVVGDPLSATTHVDLLLRARDLGVPFAVIHNASILNAIGVVGLQLYRFGQTISIPFWTAGWRPESFYDKILLNRAQGAHTLCLLDIKIDEPDAFATFGSRRATREPPQPPRFMDVQTAIEQLRAIEQRRQKPILTTPDATLVGVARIGQPTQCITVGNAEQLEAFDLGGPLHSLVICAEDLHDVELAMLEMSRSQNVSGGRSGTQEPGDQNETKGQGAGQPSI